MERVVILFDNDCGFCRWSLSKILAWDRHRRLRPVALQSPEADDLLEGMDPEPKLASWHIVTLGGVDLLGRRGRLTLGPAAARRRPRSPGSRTRSLKRRIVRTGGGEAP